MGFLPRPSTEQRPDAGPDPSDRPRTPRLAPAPEDPLGADEEDDDHDEERDDAGVGGPGDEPGVRLEPAQEGNGHLRREADHEPAEHRAVRGADPSEDDGRNNEEEEGEAHRRAGGAGEAHGGPAPPGGGPGGGP